MSADPNAALAALDDRVRAALLALGERVAGRYRGELATIARVVERAQRRGTRVTPAWLTERDEYVAFVQAFTAAWGDFERDALALILAGQGAAQERARVVAGAQLGGPITATAPTVDAATLRATLAEVGADVGRRIVAELVGG